MLRVQEDAGFRGWNAKWITRPMPDAADWERYAMEASVSVESGGATLLLGARDERNYVACALDAEAGQLRLYEAMDGVRREFGQAPAPELLVPDAIAVRVALGGETVCVTVNGRPAMQAAAPAGAKGTVGFKTEAGQRAVFRELRVIGEDGRALHVNRFYDPSVTQFSAGVIDGSGNGLRLEGDLSSVCDAPIPVDSPLLRKTFEVPGRIVKAIARVYAAGWYELSVNGRRADEGVVLAPANGPYERRLLYDVYDVTEALQPGGNAIGLWLGNGYNANYSRYGWKWKRDKAAIAQVDVELADGRTLQVVTDESWRTADSPLLLNDIYDGETFDNRKTLPRWDRFEYDDAGWSGVVLADPPGGALERSGQPPVRTQARLEPVQARSPRAGVVVYDFGQNVAGRAAVRARGAAGSRLTLRYSELAGPDGSIDPWTNRNARATDVFILAGEGVESYEPRFTYHGFRYVEVTGDAELLGIEAVTLHCDVRETGWFDSSDGLLNRIQSNLRRSILNNLVSIPTDCCQRDERTPCLMDSAVVEEAAIHNFDMQAYYRKWLGDIEDSLSNPDWSGDKVTLPWHLYTYYGDIDALRDYYEPMRSYVDHLTDKWPSGIVAEGFGDWCPPNDDGWDNYFREAPIVNTSLYARQAAVVAEAAAVLGRTADAGRYAALARSIGQAFHERFHRGDGRYGDGTQTAQLMPLAYGLVPRELVAQAVQRLTEAIAAKGNHVDTGIYGTRYLLDVLAEHGHVDLAFEMLSQRDYPSFGWQIAQGATTLWEQWSFKGGMHSHDHAMFGGIGASFYTHLAGMRPLEPGYARIGIKPYVPAGLERVEASVRTARGRIVSGWRKEEGRLLLAVEIPPGATATIELPLPDGGRERIEAGPGRHEYNVSMA